MQKWQDLGSEITEWIKSYAENNKIKTLVVGVSGGIDSAVVSTLCAKTGLDTIVLNMPIHQSKNQFNLSNKHIASKQVGSIGCITTYLGPSRPDDSTRTRLSALAISR